MAGLQAGGRACAAVDATDEYIDARMRDHAIPGLALAVVRNGQTAKLRAYGSSNLELGTPATVETVFEIGSLTKQFTATLVLLLAEEGRVGLEDPIPRYFPGAPENWRKITVRHLLAHTSGLTNYTGLSGFEVARKLDRAGFVRALAPHPLLFEPGSAWSYCNSGYNLLGYVIEEVAGKSYWQTLRERILEPACLRSIQSRDLATVITNRADGYEFAGRRLTNRDSDLTDVFAAGALVSTVTDLARWDNTLDAGKLVPAKVQERLWSPTRLNNGTDYPYGFGWRLHEHQGCKGAGHSGSTSGFSAGWLRFPEQRFAVIVLCNLGEEGLAMRIARGVASLQLPVPPAAAR
jgi:CubicO group peptidase (beta-lactamase class C family)